MKLVEGAYENLISQELESSLVSLPSHLVHEVGNVDKAESSSMLTEYVSKIIKRRLDDKELSLDDKKFIVNKIIKFLGAEDNEELVDADRVLTEIISRDTALKKQVTKSSFPRPLSGFRVSNLFTGGQSHISLFSEIERDILSSDRISLIISFLRLSGVNLIYDSLKKFCSSSNHKLRIITTTYCNVTEGKALEKLSKLPNTEIKISYNTKIERLHAKSYIFERNSGMDTAYIGSSNLSKSAQTDGLEWNIRVTSVENPHIIKTALATFDIYWNSRSFEDFREGGIARFNESYKIERNSFKGETYFNKYMILPHQKEILEKIDLERENNLKRNLIVAATGTGKTVISSFDYKRYFDSHPGKNRLLFVAHREEILKQALRTYQSVLEDANFGQLWVGNYKPTSSFEYLFISVQSFNSNFEDVFSKLSRDYYNYIVIDEAHHSVADSYRQIIDHFDPDILLGLTATPERMDGASLLPDFGGKISAEIRLPEALAAGLLTPFQYYCVSDTTDLSDDDLMEGNKYNSTKLSPKLCSKERVGLIIDRLRFYLADEYSCKALCFCATQEHARFMSESFEQAGFQSACLTSDNKHERNHLNKALRKGSINYLFVVDIFNEGVDIPEVDTVLFLRPTDSLTVFLQQLGRGLRLSPGKSLLTVLDFVGHLNAKFDYVGRFRGLIMNRDRDIVKEIKEGFTMLPPGCSIHMEEKAKEYVLQTINSAIYSPRRLARELASYSITPTLTEFINGNGQDIRIIYKGNRCWSSLKRDSKKISYPDKEFTKTLEKGMGRLIHNNTESFLLFLKEFVKSKSSYHPRTLSDKRYCLMLYYALFQDKLNYSRFNSIFDALSELRNYPYFLEEIDELASYLLSQRDMRTFVLDKDNLGPLEQYGRYTREDIFCLLGVQTPDKRMQGQASGVFNVKHIDTELLFVTLNKSDKDFSPSTQYDDYVMGEDMFHWQSQNTDSHSNKSGQRFIEHNKTGKKFILFVRENKKDAFGRVSPFYCFGYVHYVSSHGDRPMNIEWKLEEPVIPKFLKTV